MNRAAGFQQAKHRVGKAALGLGWGRGEGKDTELSICSGKGVVNHTNLTTEKRPVHSRDKPVEHLLFK